VKSLNQCSGFGRTYSMRSVLARKLPLLRSFGRSNGRIKAVARTLYTPTLMGTSGSINKLTSTPLGPFFALGFGTFWSLLGFGNKDQQSSSALIELKEPGPFVHPFSEHSWLYRCFYFLKRSCYLFLLFTPVTLVSLLAYFTKSQWLQEMSLLCLDWAGTRSGVGMQKFLQWISMRPDKFHPKLIQVAARFREDSPAHDYEVTRNIFSEEFEKEIEEVFEWFDEVPLASGTIAQVHRARIRPEYAVDPSNREVVVKVRHENKLLESFTDPYLICSFCELTFFILKTIIPFNKDGFANNLQKQTDLKREAYNMSKFQENFKDDSWITFPSVYPQFCSEAILVESFCEGRPLNDLVTGFGDNEYGYVLEKKEIQNDLSQEERTKLAEHVFDLTMKMYFRDNFAHGDLHAGNLLVNDKNQLVLLDTGLTLEIEDKQESGLDRFFDLLEHSVNLDAQKFSDVIISFHEGENQVDRKKLTEMMQAKMDHYGQNYGALYGASLHAFEAAGVDLRGDIGTSILNLGIIDGMMRGLDKDFNCSASAQKWFIKRKTEMIFRN